jgi:hypothetical protein
MNAHSVVSDRIAGPGYPRLFLTPTLMSSSNLPPFIPNTTGITYTEPPQPEWTYGQGIEATADGRAWAEGEKAGWKTIDTATEDPRFLCTFYSPRKISNG